MPDQTGVRGSGLRAEPRPSYQPERQAGLDPDLKRIGLLAAGVGGAMALVAGLVTLVGHTNRGLPIIEAEGGPVRVKPADAGGMKVNGSELGSGTGAQSLGPVSEQPAISELRQQLRTMKKQVAVQGQEAKRAEVMAADADRRRVITSPVPQAASATARIPAIPPIVRPPVPAAPMAANDFEAALSPGVRVQLAAFTDAQAARGEWESLVKKMPELLRGRRAEVTSVHAAGRTMWRLRTGPFKGVAEATGFCAKMRTGGADCSIAAF